MPPPGPVGGPASFGLVGPVAASLHHIDQTGKVRELSFCMQQRERQNTFREILCFFARYVNGRYGCRRCAEQTSGLLPKSFKITRNSHVPQSSTNSAINCQVPALLPVCRAGTCSCGPLAELPSDIRIKALVSSQTCSSSICTALHNKTHQEHHDEIR